MNNDYFDQSNILIAEIVKQAISAVSDKWDLINLNVRFADGVIEIKPSYVSGEVESSIVLSVGDFNPKLAKLKELNSFGEKGELKGLTFQITPDGKFDVEYSY